MLKRQDLWLLPLGRILLISIFFFLIQATSACQPSPTPAPTQTLLPETQNPTHTPSETLTPSISPTPATVPTISPTPTMDCLAMGGWVQRASFTSEILGDTFQYLIYLPPCYQEETRAIYPALYLLHGLGSTNEQWLRLGLAETMDNLIAEGEITPYIVILPLESPFLPPQRSHYPEVVVTELVPWVDEHYQTQTSADSRGIGGLSRGAAWAFQIGFENHEVFSRVGAHSLPLFKADGAHMYTWLTQSPVNALPLFYIDIGRSDPERQSAQEVADLLNEYRIPHEWHLFNGEHSETYWSQHLEGYLRWYAQEWCVELK